MKTSLLKAVMAAMLIFISMHASVVNNTWFISSFVAVVNMNMRLGWMSSNEVNGFDRSNAFITHYIGADWDNYPMDTATIGINNTFQVERMNITSLSPFAVVDSSTWLSVGSAMFTNNVAIYPNPAIDYVNVEIENNATDVFTYEVLDTSGKLRMNISNSGTRNIFDFNGFENGFYIIHITNTCKQNLHC